MIASIKSNSCNSLSNLFPSTADSRQEQSPTNQEIHCWIRLHSHPPGVGEWRYQLRKSIIRVCLDAFKANFSRTMHGVEIFHRKFCIESQIFVKIGAVSSRNTFSSKIYVCPQAVLIHRIREFFLPPASLN